MTPKQFKATRKALGMTQAGLAKALDITPRTVRRYEGGATIPRRVELAMAQLRVMAANKTIGL